MTGRPEEDEPREEGERPPGQPAGGGENPTEPMSQGDENQTEPMPRGEEGPTESLAEGDESPTEPIAKGDESPTGPEEDSQSGLWILLGSIVAAVVLVGAYLAAGGLDFKPAAAADPCDAREWGNPQGLEQTAERFSLAAVDGAACQLGVSREELIRALADPNGRQRLAEEKDLSEMEIEDAIRSGLERAIDDGENAGSIGSLTASGLRIAVKVMPVTEMAALALDASEVFQNGGFDGIGSLIDGALDAFGGSGSGGSSGGGDSGGGRSGGGSGSGTGLDELGKQLEKNLPNEIPEDLDQQIQKGLEGLLGP
ncbi:MAG: hypothetical protein JJE10_07325 [Thermoleophilia bacterium]|nr:hypothetical protein [Thermoleophilia bacterium]